MYCLKLHTVLMLLLLGSLSSAAQGNLMFEKANELFRNKNYDSAARLYNQLIENDFCSADLYYNAGNAFYRSQHIGMAIWAYKKSLAICQDKNVEDNYLIAKKQIEKPLINRSPIFFIRWWRALYGLFSVNAWSLIALLSFLLWLGMKTYERLRKDGFPGWLKNSLLGIAAFAFIFLFVAYYNAVHHYSAVVIKDSTLYKNTNKKVLEPITEGVEVRLEARAEKGDLLKVQLPDSRSAWISKRDIKKI